MAQLRVNRFGRTYASGKALSIDMRDRIINRSVNEGLSYAETSRQLCVSESVAGNIVKNYETSGAVEAKDLKLRRSNSSKLSLGDRILIETMVDASSTTSLRGMQTELQRFGDCGLVSLLTISRHIRITVCKKTIQGRVSKLVQERFTSENVVNTQLYFDYVSTKDPVKLKFFMKLVYGFPMPACDIMDTIRSGSHKIELKSFYLMKILNIFDNFFSFPFFFQEFLG